MVNVDAKKKRQNTQRQRGNPQSRKMARLQLKLRKLHRVVDLAENKLYQPSESFFSGFLKHPVCSLSSFRLRNDLYCVGWSVELYSLTHCCYGCVYGVVLRRELIIPAVVNSSVNMSIYVAHRQQPPSPMRCVRQYHANKTV